MWENDPIKENSTWSLSIIRSDCTGEPETAASRRLRHSSRSRNCRGLGKRSQRCCSATSMFSIKRRNFTLSAVTSVICFTSSASRYLMSSSSISAMRSFLAITSARSGAAPTTGTLSRSFMSSLNSAIVAHNDRSSALDLLHRMPRPT